MAKRADVPTLEEIDEMVEQYDKNLQAKKDDDDKAQAAGVGGAAEQTPLEPQVSSLVGGIEEVKKPVKKTISTKDDSLKKDASRAMQTLNLVQQGYNGKGLEIDIIYIQWVMSQNVRLKGFTTPPFLSFSFRQNVGDKLEIVNNLLKSQFNLPSTS